MDIKINEGTAVIFDLDDTLYNELDFLKSGFRHIAASLQPHAWKPLYARMFSLYRNNMNTFDVISMEFNVSRETLIRRYREHIPEISLFEGARELMDAIKVQRGMLGILTDGRRLTQMNKINALGLARIMDKIVISEDIGSEKPDERNFKAIELQLKASNSYYYIADNLKKDFIAPNKRGWKTIGLLDNGMNIHFDSHLYMDQNYMPNDFISSFKEINIM
jgi:putative hydrolase of the HAD superfamily